MYRSGFYSRDLKIFLLHCHLHLLPNYLLDLLSSHYHHLPFHLFALPELLIRCNQPLFAQILSTHFHPSLWPCRQGRAPAVSDLELPPSPDLAPEPELPPSPDLEPEPKLPPSPDLAPEPRLPPSPGLEPAAALLPPAPLAALAARLLRSFFFFLSLLAKKLSRLRSSVSAMAAVRMGGAGGGRGARGSELWVKAGCALRLPGAASPQPRGVAEARAAGRPAPPCSGGTFLAGNRERGAGSRPPRCLRDKEGAHRRALG